MLLLVVVALSTVLTPILSQEPECVCLEELEEARGLTNPVVLRTVPDGQGRKFIGEQIGLVWVYMPDGEKLPEPFLNLTEIVRTGGRVGDERGFLALAFHPQFSENGRVFIYYSIGVDNDEFTRMSEVTLAEGQDNIVNPASERILMNIYQPFANHNGGEVRTDGNSIVFLLNICRL